MTERIGGWIQTFSGGRIWPLDPRPGEIHNIGVLQRRRTLLPRSRPVTRSAEARRAAARRERGVSVRLAATAEEKPRLRHAVSGRRAGIGGDDCGAVRLRLPLRFGGSRRRRSPARNRSRATDVAVHPAWPDYGAPVGGLILPCWIPARARTEFLNRFAGLESLREWEQAKAAMANGM